MSAQNWYQDQLTNKNFLSPIGFVFLLEKSRKVSFLCQKASIPELNLGDVSVPTRGLVRVPLEGNIQYGDLTLDFIVDEDLRNYMEIHNWLRALGTPDNYGERTSWMMEHGDSKNLKNNRMAKTSDGTLQVLNNNNVANFDVVFEDMFPVSLSTLDFNVTNTDTDYLTASVTFKYLLYEIRNTNQRTRR
jgi:hypothetical protein|tara:strand:- start:7705 stop:8271 length:567 start_codon:yes stop_codon:yes gene_type:complete